jgi:hypothetical protein
MEQRNHKRSRFTRRVAAVMMAGAALIPVAGCSHAPNFNILGSYFPAWLLCITAGISLAGLAYWGLQRLHIESEVKPSILVYPCMAAFLAFTLWLLLFS